MVPISKEKKVDNKDKEKNNIDNLKIYLRSFLAFCKVFHIFEFVAPSYMCFQLQVEKYFQKLIFSVPLLPFPLLLFKEISNTVHITSREVWISVGQKLQLRSIRCFLLLFLFPKIIYLGNLINLLEEVKKKGYIYRHE